MLLETKRYSQSNTAEQYDLEELCMNKLIKLWEKVLLKLAGRYSVNENI